ncbi:hypothetical protein MOV08_33635 [Streptomyces yunnanensis]|uniref:Phage integrase family protein n=1 Tax=Streptomyces yunnanensis TaxID=156453 RepID=A0ABY8AFF4_9ACTN|nr:hypothetical protein [Streptomyces yunnanensis]WEB43734.1 hypothetical protein MOV08_33635 [Streptomyces yunnanensis]
MDTPPGRGDCRRILRLHVLPHLGRKTMAQVTAAGVEELYARWAKAGAKPNTIEARSIALSSLFSHAVRHKRIANNPVQEAEKPANLVVPVDERGLPGLEEIQAIAHSIGPRLEPAIWLMACGGLRIGESLDVFPEDFQDGTLRLRRQIVRYRDMDGVYAARYASLKHRKEGEWRDVPLPEFFAAYADRFPIPAAGAGGRLGGMSVTGFRARAGRGAELVLS